MWVRVPPSVPMKFRTLVRIVTLWPTNMDVIIPGWNPHKTVRINYDDLWGALDIDEGRFFVKANLSAKTEDELEIEYFE